jgi:hypothetical protein
MAETRQFKYSAEVVVKGKYLRPNRNRHLGLVYGYNLSMIKAQARFSAHAAGLHRRKLELSVAAADGSCRTLTVIS